MGIGRPVGLRWSSQADGPASPAVLGVWRPTVLLPESMRDWSPEHLRPILAHELAHIRRRDPLVNLLQIIVQAVYWFHPLVWIANARLRNERELACDDMAVALLEGDSAQYSRGLLRVMETRLREPVFGATGLAMAERRSTLGRRVRRVLDAKYRPEPSTRRWAMAGVVSLGLACIALAAEPISDDAPTTGTAIPKDAKDYSLTVVSPDCVMYEYTLCEEDPAKSVALLKQHFPSFSVMELNAPVPKEVEEARARDPYHHMMVSGQDLIVSSHKKTVEEVAALLWEKELIFEPPPGTGLDLQSYSLVPNDKANTKSEEHQQYTARVVESIEAFLYPNGTKQKAAKEGRRLYWEPDKLLLRVVDTPGNLKRVTEYLDSLPELRKVNSNRETAANSPSQTAGRGLHNQEYSLKPCNVENVKPEQSLAFASRVVEAVKTFLYAKDGEAKAAEEGRRLVWDPAKLQLTITDTPENLNRVDDYIDSLPELGEQTRILKLTSAKAADVSAGLKERFAGRKLAIEINEKENTVTLKGPQGVLRQATSMAATELNAMKTEFQIEGCLIKIPYQKSGRLAKLQADLNRLDLISETQHDSVMQSSEIRLLARPRLSIVDGESGTITVGEKTEPPSIMFTVAPSKTPGQESPYHCWCDVTIRIKDKGQVRELQRSMTANMVSAEYYHCMPIRDDVTGDCYYLFWQAKETKE